MSDLEKAINGDKEAFSRVIIQNKEAMYKTAIVILKKHGDNQLVITVFFDDI